MPSNTVPETWSVNWLPINSSSPVTCKGSEDCPRRVCIWPVISESPLNTNWSGSSAKPSSSGVCLIKPIKDGNGVEVWYFTSNTGFLKSPMLAVTLSTTAPAVLPTVPSTYMPGPSNCATAFTCFTCGQPSAYLRSTFSTGAMACIRPRWFLNGKSSRSPTMEKRPFETWPLSRDVRSQCRVFLLIIFSGQ